MIKSFLAFLTATILLSFSVQANERQSIYDMVLNDSNLLLSAIEQNQSKDEIRQKAVILAEGLKLLAFSEAEARVSDKIAPPPGAEFPTVSNEIVIMDKQPGSITSIDEVPNDWFTGYLEISRSLVLKFLKDHDQISNELIYVQAGTIKKAIEKIIQPPH